MKHLWSRAGIDWRPAPALVVIKNQLDTAFPHRDHASDGMIGDATHAGEGKPTYNAQGYATSGTDHEPDNNGLVCAFDIDEDLAPNFTGHDLALILAAARDPRIGYIISHSQIFSNKEGTDRWAWRPYGGADHHDGHVHLSLKHLKQFTDDQTTWQIAPSLPKASLDVSGKAVAHNAAPNALIVLNDVGDGLGDTLVGIRCKPFAFPAGKVTANGTQFHLSAKADWIMASEDGAHIVVHYPVPPKGSTDEYPTLAVIGKVA